MFLIMFKQRQLCTLYDRRGRAFEVWTPNHERTTPLERLNVYHEDVRVGYINLIHQLDTAKVHKALA